MSQPLDGVSGDPEPIVSAVPDESPWRKMAIDRLERRRRFHIELGVSALGMAVLIVVWAISEYHNAGGLPTGGFSESSGTHDVWNVWIVYPLLAWVLFLVARSMTTFRRGPIREHHIRREMERQARREWSG